MFFKGIEDFKTYIPVNYNFVIESVTTYLNDVDRNVFKKYLGKTFLDQLQSTFDDELSFDTVPAPQKELIESLRIASAHLALVKWLPMAQVNISQLGITINNTAEMKTAFQWQIKDIENYCNETGYKALDDALEYLEDNIDETVFASYKSSNEFKENNYLFIPSAKELCKYVSSFENSRVNFYKIRSTIRKVEDFDIKAVLLPDLFADLKTKLQAGTTLGSLNTALVELIKPALANLVIAKGINEMAISINAQGIMVFDNTGSSNTLVNVKQAPDLTLARICKAAENDGAAYLKALIDYLETNKLDYPLFLNDAKYSGPDEDVDLNDGTRPFFVGM